MPRSHEDVKLTGITHVHALPLPSQDDYRPLYVTGHSLGGALASLAAYDIDKNFTLPDPMTLYT